MKVNDLQKSTRRRRYDGPPIEKGGTSIKGSSTKASPGLQWLIRQGAFAGAGAILDYGAGKYGRNSMALRKLLGVRVYSYDPFNGKQGANGWEKVATTLPSRLKFNVGFSTFVLNVVPEYVEKQIIQRVGSRCESSFHIVRDDIFLHIKNALLRGDKLVSAFFLDEFATPNETQLYEAGQLPDSTIMEFCQFGTVTNHGFQRMCTPEDFGLRLLKSKKNSFRIYGA